MLETCLVPYICAALLQVRDIWLMDRVVQHPPPYPIEHLGFGQRSPSLRESKELGKHEGGLGNAGRCNSFLLFPWHPNTL